MTDDEAIARVREWLHGPWTDTHSPDREWQERIARLGLRGASPAIPQPHWVFDEVRGEWRIQVETQDHTNGSGA